MPLINFKIIFVSMLMLIFYTDSSFAIIVDSCNCIDYNVNVVTNYPIVTNPVMRYYLFTPDNLVEGVEIQYGNYESLSNSKFNKNLPTRIFIGGRKSVPQNCKTALIKDAYVNLGCVNFILVDWSDWSTRDFLSARDSVNEVGNLLGCFTKFLNANGVSFSNIYLIGFGFGAHVAGAAGNSIKPDQYDTIFALDAAGPGFTGLDSEYRLDPSDALYVEAIHTDMFLWGYGSSTPLGHAQFYPNNGVRTQPFCPIDKTITQSCSHTAAIDYFVNSLNPSTRFCSTVTTWVNVFSKVIPELDKTCAVVMGGEPSIKKACYYYVPVSNTCPCPA